MENPGLTQVFWGNGKGKTTAALGTALRACGSGLSVHLVQFMKNGTGDSFLDLPGEISSLDKFDNFSFRRFGSGSWVTKKPPAKKHTKEASEALTHIKQILNKKDFDIIIADEILYAVSLGLLKEEQVIELINSKPQDKELILTGSHKALPNIFKIADLVTEVKKHKHPFDKGIPARKGLEY